MQLLAVRIVAYGGNTRVFGHITAPEVFRGRVDTGARRMRHDPEESHEGGPCKILLLKVCRIRVILDHAHLADVSA